MLEHLTVKPIRALQGAKLEELGKLNVICGKNNSGKSTLLEGIATQALRVPGRTFTDEVVQQLVASIGVSDRGFVRAGLEEYVRRTIARQKIWYKSDGNHFEEILQQLHQRAHNRLLVQGPGFAARTAFDEMFGKEVSAVLVPPKRALQVGCSVHAGAGVAPDGNGILNFLFYSKNQAPNSTDRQLYDRILHAFRHISDGYEFDIFLNQNNELFLSFAHNGATWVSAADCGLGLQDLLVLLFFANSPPYNVVAIEEPESHLHPDMQRRLLAHLREAPEKQFFLTTHSNVFLNSALIDRVFYTRFDKGVIVDDATSRTAILNDLGYEVTDNLVSDLIILVEGPSDLPVVQEFLVKLGLYSEYLIKIWPLGGDIMDQLDVGVFAERYQLIALLDKDPGSDRVRRRFAANCEALGIPVHRLECYSLENYFTLGALRTVFKGQIDADLEALQPDIAVEKQIQMNVKKSNRRITEAMSLEDITDTDLMAFFDRVRELCERSRSN